MTDIQRAAVAYARARLIIERLHAVSWDEQRRAMTEQVRAQRALVPAWTEHNRTVREPLSLGAYIERVLGTLREEAA